jgi:hypothetical protein
VLDLLISEKADWSFARLVGPGCGIGFDGMRRVVGDMSRTLTDHEERIKALEGE